VRKPIWANHDSQKYTIFKNRISAGEKLSESECKEYDVLLGRFIKHRLDTDSEFRSAYEILAKGFQAVSALKAQGVLLSAEEEEKIRVSFIQIAIKRGIFNLGDACI